MISDDLDMDSYDCDFDTSINKAKGKGSLDKNLEHWHCIGTHSSIIDAIKNG